MSRNGSGTYNLPSNSWNPAVNGNNATAADWQALINDVASAITQSVSSDGQTPMTGNLPMGNNRITGLATASAGTDAINLAQARLLGPTFPGSGLTYSTNTSLSASQAGVWGLYTAGSVTVTLPTVASMAVIGQTFTFIGGTVGGTIKGSGAETIASANGTTANTYAVGIGETVQVAVNGAGTWYVIASGFGSPSFASVKANPGSQKLPGGLIMQWGSVATTATGVSASWQTAFPTSILSITATPNIAGPGFVTYQTPTTSGAFFQGWNDTGTQIALAFTYMAIGY